MEDSLSFAEILDGHMRRVKLGSHCLGKESGIPKQTIEGWLRGKRPRDWKIACKIAHTLGLDQPDVDTFLAAAGHPPVAILARRAQSEQDYTLLSRWVERAQPQAEPEVSLAATALPQPQQPVPSRAAGLGWQLGQGRYLRPQALIGALLVGVAALVLMVSEVGRRREAVAPPTAITDQPNNTDIESVQFDYDPTYSQGSLRLYLCVKSRYARIRSEELAPNPRLLVDHLYRADQGCAFKYPVIALMVGDVEEVAIGTGDSTDITSMRVYRIARTERGLQGGFMRQEQRSAAQP